MTVFCNNKGNLIAQAYNQILANYLVPFIESKHGGENDPAIFQQDNAGAHSALHTAHCFFNNTVLVLDCPAKLPYMNVIESAWSWLVLNVYQRYRQFEYVDDLKEAFIDAWDRMLQDYINSLINSIPSRCGNAKTEKGGVTKC